tara:strand:- start:683 stop:1648 length:966 start_codon:yes stop_codon:yes gene_type:complete
MEALLTDHADKRVWDLLDDYLASPDFLRLSDSTRQEYRRVAGYLDDHVGHVALDQVRRPLLRSFRDRWAADGHRAATLRLQLLKNACRPLIDDEVLPLNLFFGVSRVKARGRRVEPHPVWTPAEVADVLVACAHMPGLVRAVGLARYGAFRRDDLCRLPTTARVREGAQVRYQWRSGKSLIGIEHLEDPRLTELLDERTTSAAPTIAYNRRGGAWHPRQLSQALARVLGRLEGKGVVRPGLTWHGLRHTRGVELAEAGCSDAIIMAQLGHTTDRSAQIYRRQASRRRLGDVGQELVNASVRVHPAATASPDDGWHIRPRRP